MMEWFSICTSSISLSHLLEEAPHLRLLRLKPLDLLMDPLVFLELLQRGPLTVQVGTEHKKVMTNFKFS